MNNLVNLITIAVIFFSSEKQTQKTHQYESLSIPEFFTELTENHLQDFYRMDSASFIDLANQNNLSKSNISNFYTIKILHELFTTKTSSNCSRGEILNIPYQWHWRDPNPRKEIRFLENGKLLKDEPPANEFSKYQSYADIDRTPYLFLSDLVSPKVKYYSECGEFSSFGWCSEREMAFTSLTRLMGFKSSVIVSGAHTWTEIIIPMKTDSGHQCFEVSIDNTYNTINWKKSGCEAINGKNWYNKMVDKDLDRIKNHIVPNEVMADIENRVIEYLNRNLPHEL